MLKLFRVWSNDLWFIFHNSSWSFPGPYFSRKHMFHDSYRVTNLQISAKLFSNVLIFKIFLSTSPSIIHFISLSSKSFVNFIFYGAENNIEKMWQLTIQILFSNWFTLVPEKHFVRLYYTRKLGLFCSTEMYCFEELPCLKQNI